MYDRVESNVVYTALFFISLHTYRPHSSLGFYTPYQAHFDSHVASHLARAQSTNQRARQARIAEFEGQRPAKDRIQIGDKVLLRAKTKTFQKLSSVFNPYFTDRIYTVESIDKRYLPWLYRLKETADGKRKFYAFELQKLDKDYQSVQSDNVNASMIKVKDVILEGDTRLRSGRTVRGRGTPIYFIERDGQMDRVPESTLRILRSSLGADSLIYDDSFKEESKKQFVI